MLRLAKGLRFQFMGGIIIGFVVCVVMLDFGSRYRRYVEPIQDVEGDPVLRHEQDRYLHDFMQKEDQHHHHDDTSKAEELKTKVRVLCWVMTSPDNFRTKADAVKHTWGKRCNVLLFFSSQTDEHLNTIALDVEEGRKHLTAKTMKAFKYVYEHHFDDADWFMKCDDDTYVIVENLRYFLSSKDSNDPVFFGHHFHTIVKQGYHSGGAGYVLSKEALRRLSTREEKMCREDGGAEDAEMGKCMEKLGIQAGKSTDSLGRSRFHCLSPESHLQGHYPGWYYKYDSSGAKSGIGNISDYAISFHYVKPDKMLTMEFFVYHLRPYGIIAGKQDLN